MQVVPVCSDDGFYDLDSIAQYARRVTPAEFLATFRAPALQMAITPQNASVQQPLERSIRPTLSEAEGKEHETRRSEPDTPAALQYAHKVAFLKKRPGNPFPNMISIGRAMNNDIAIVLETVSKVHAYFLDGGGDRWSLIDHRSKNGTLVNGRPLEAGKGQSVRDGDSIRIGLEVTATFHVQNSFYRILRGA